MGNVVTFGRLRRVGPSHLRVVECDCLKPTAQAETARKPEQTEDEIYQRSQRTLYAAAGATLGGARKPAQGPDWE
jgi:hypothetical protein